MDLTITQRSDLVAEDLFVKNRDMDSILRRQMGRTGYAALGRQGGRSNRTRARSSNW